MSCRDSKDLQPDNTKSSTFSSSTPVEDHPDDMPPRVSSLPSYLSHRRSNSEKTSSSYKAPAQTSITHVETTPVPPRTSATSSNSHRRNFFGSFSRSRSRSKSPKPAPEPLNTAIEKEAFIYHTGQRTNSPPPMSPDTMSSTSPVETSTKKKRHSNSYSARKSSSDYKRLSGTVQHRGRHANDWLFGGFSVRDQVGKLWRDSSDDERDNK